MWIDKNQNESAAQLETRLVQLGAKVTTAKHVATALAYSSNGITLRQRETMTTDEFRGLTKDAAILIASQHTDTTQQTTYYRDVGGQADYAAIAITTGQKTDYVASRSNEADGWRVTKTTTAYEADDVSGWSTTRPTISSTGVQVSKDMRKSLVWDSLYAVETTTVTEYRFLTKAEADTKVSQNTSNNVVMHCYHKYTQETVAGAWCYAQCGTNKTAAARYVDAERGYTVTVTQSDFSAEGTNWHYSL